MSLALHENVRLQVSLKLVEILREVVKQRCRVSPSLELSVLESFLEKGVPEQIAVLMPQEVYVAGSRFRVDAVFGGVIAFDYKSREEEFDSAVDTAKAKYLPYLGKVKYFVVTNYGSWRIYRVSRDAGVQLAEVYRGGRDGAVDTLKQIIAGEVKALRIPPHPALIEALYTMDVDRLINNMRAAFNSVVGDPRVKPLFEAYRKIMEMLYGEEVSNKEEFYSDLFVKHTVMHMMAMASLAAALNIYGDPIDVCSGALLTSNGVSLDVALPYLNWWRIVYRDLPKDLQEKVVNVAEDIAVRARLVDWELGGSEDVFRRLYEVLVEPETRRRIGEYYTPLWIVDAILREFELKGRLVMDPFCGSGTFLVRAFYRKVFEEGEEPDEAYKELVGLDVNPLAVAIARAELVIAYHRVRGVNPCTPPRVYHTDTLAVWIGGKALAIDDPLYTGLVELVTNYIGAQSIANRAVMVKKMRPQDVLASLSRIEQLLATGIIVSLQRRDRSFEENLKSFLMENLRDENLLEKMFKEVVAKTDFTQRLASLVEKYGNSVWAITVVSAMVPSIVMVFKPHIVVTNPPWVQVTKYQSSYSKDMRKIAASILGEALGVEAKKVASIVTGSDVACIALCKALEVASEGVGFVMPREQSFYSRSPMRSGIILTYAIIKSMCRENCSAKLIDVDYDAFDHGVYPALVMVRKAPGGGIR